MKGQAFALFSHLHKTLQINYVLIKSRARTSEIERGSSKIERGSVEPYINVILLKARSIAHDQHCIVSLKQNKLLIEQKELC